MNSPRGTAASFRVNRTQKAETSIVSAFFSAFHAQLMPGQDERSRCGSFAQAHAAPARSVLAIRRPYFFFLMYGAFAAPAGAGTDLNCILE